MNQPRSTDATLGGDSPIHLNSAVLGGIEGLKQQLKVANPELRSQLMPQALNYEEAGIDLVISVLKNDPVLTVRGNAYQCLRDIITSSNTAKPPRFLRQKIQRAIAKGIPLNRGDRLYAVYIPMVDYDDEYYTLYDSVPAYEVVRSFYGTESFQLIKRYIAPEIAQRVALDLHRLILCRGSLAEFNHCLSEFNHKHQLDLELDNSSNYLIEIARDIRQFSRNFQKPVRSWCLAHNIDISVCQDILSEPPEDEDDYRWRAQESLLEYLQEHKNCALLEELCDYLEIGKYAFVQEEIVEKNRFLPYWGSKTIRSSVA